MELAMAGPSSHIPANISKSPQQGQSTSGEGEAQTVPSRSTPQTAGKADQFSRVAVSDLLHEMKKAVTRQADQQFNPTRLVGQAMQAPQKNLSPFEKMFLEFFMGVRKFAAFLRKGQKKFRKKKKDEWKEFFERLFPYTKEKKIALGKIRELIFRGLSTEDPRLVSQPATARGTLLVADIVFSTGRTDKFVRLPLSANGHQRELEKMQPGERISVEHLPRYFDQEQLDYLGLHYKPIRPLLPSQLGGDLAQNMTRQADAAARAREAMMNSSMGLSSQAANLAAEGVKKESGKSSSAEPAEGYADQDDAAKHSKFKNLFRRK